MALPYFYVLLFFRQEDYSMSPFHRGLTVMVTVAKLLMLPPLSVAL